MLTDRDKFTKYIKLAFNSLIQLFLIQDKTDKDIYNYYFKKNKVNQFRIRSKY